MLRAQAQLPLSSRVAAAICRSLSSLPESPTLSIRGFHIIPVVPLVSRKEFPPRAAFSMAYAFRANNFLVEMRIPRMVADF